MVLLFIWHSVYVRCNALPIFTHAFNLHEKMSTYIWNLWNDCCTRFKCLRVLACIILTEWYMITCFLLIIEVNTKLLVFTTIFNILLTLFWAIFILESFYWKSARGNICFSFFEDINIRFLLKQLLVKFHKNMGTTESSLTHFP